MKTVYCSNCGKRLSIMRKALPKYATIIDIVEFHKCSKDPVEIDLTPVDILKFNEDKANNKFVSKLNDLAPTTTFGGVSTANLRDRRFEVEVEREKPKSSAPPSVLGLIKSSEE